MQLEIEIKLRKGDGEYAPETIISNYSLLVGIKNDKIYNEILIAITRILNSGEIEEKYDE